MNQTILVAGGGVLVAVLAVIAWLIVRHSKKSGGATAFNKDGLAVSDKALKDQRMGASFILANIEDGVVMVGPDNRINLFNPAASRISGWPATEAVGLDFNSVLQLYESSNKPYSPEAHPIAKALATGQPIRDSEGRLAIRGTKFVPVSIVVSPLVVESGKPSGSVVGVIRDITKEKAEESQRSEFISTASHEMRTPIAAIEGYLALAQNPKVAKIDENAQKILIKATEATKHLGQLFADLLTSSRADDGRLSNNPQVLEAGEILKQVVDTARFSAKDKGLQLNYIVSKDQEVARAQVMRPLYYIHADPNRLREVFQNIVDNAIKYTSEGSVTVRLTGDGSVVQIQVEDTGLGIAPEDIPHLFQKFYRVDNSMTRTVGGTGLGLYICKKIIEMSNGRLWVESQSGKGSVFFINLPRLTSQRAMEIQRGEASQIKPTIDIAPLE